MFIEEMYRISKQKNLWNTLEYMYNLFFY